MEDQINNYGIDHTWVLSYINMRMKVADWWWEGCNGTQCYPGMIIKYDGVNGRWLLLLDDGRYPKRWSMRWDAVRKFADKKAPTYKDYNLCPCLLVTRSVTPDFDNTTDWKVLKLSQQA